MTKVLMDESWRLKKVVLDMGVKDFNDNVIYG